MQAVIRPDRDHAAGMQVSKRQAIEVSNESHLSGA
jgi:hypothetical protein